MVSQPPVLANLHTILYQKLLDDEPQELSRLLKACQTDGFFYLDLHSASPLLGLYRNLMTLTEKYFDQPVESKLLDVVSDVRGYKPVGTFAGVKEGARDGFEVLKISRAGMLDRTQVLPKPVQDGNHTVLNYLRESDNIAKTILRKLASQLGRDSVDVFENAHADSDSTKSITILGLLRYPKGQKQECGHNMHTDAGTITLLLTQQWGLQILDPQTREWQYVEPKPGFAIVNVGDSLRFLSRKRLNSAVHRVLPQEDTLREDRFSICYFLRPNDDVLFPDQDGKMTMSAQEWYVQKFKTFKQTHEEQATESFLMGGMHFTKEMAV